jgi:hypothetical protein
MANPEQGPEQDGLLGTWKQVALQPPDFLAPVKTAVDGLFGTLQQGLTLLSSVLDFVKNFIPNLIDPIQAVIDKILKAIEDLLADLRQTGLYVHGDFYLLEGPDYRDLLGGYAGYEQRMIARLLDRTDPNRPNLGPSSPAVAVFLYVNVDIDAIMDLVKFIEAVKGVFALRRPKPKGLGVPINLQATFGQDGATIFSFGSGAFDPVHPQEVQNAIHLTWDMAPVPGELPFSFLQAPPRGFLVHVATQEEPLPVLFEKPEAGSLEALQIEVDPSTRVVGQCLDSDGNPLVLHGGADQILQDPQVDYNSPVGVGGILQPDAHRVFTAKSPQDPSPIPLAQLETGGTYYLQRTYFVPFAQNVFFPGRGFGVTLRLDEFPLAADWEVNSGKSTRKDGTAVVPPTYFIRVQTTTKEIKSNTDFRWELSATAVRDEKGPRIPVVLPASMDDVGEVSSPLEISTPTESLLVYQETVVLALLVLVLCRADATVLQGRDGKTLNYPPGPTDVDQSGNVISFWSYYQGKARLATGLESIASSLLPKILGRASPDTYYKQAGVVPERFRKKLLRRVLALANDLYRRHRPPKAIQDIVVSAGLPLRQFDLGTFDISLATRSLLDLMSWTDDDLGLALNPSSLGLVDDASALLIERETRSTEVLQRAPHFFFAAADSGPNGKGSLDSAPVVFVRDLDDLQKIAFVRNLLTDEVYGAAVTVLQAAAGPDLRPVPDKGWIAVRLFPQGLPGIEQYLVFLQNFLKSLTASTQAIADYITKQIEKIQAQIAELQSFLNRIQALIDNLLRTFEGIAPAAGLVTVSGGTDGVLASLVSAQGKPQDSPESYGGGVVLIASGGSGLALDLFKKLFGG